MGNAVHKSEKVNDHMFLAPGANKENAIANYKRRKRYITKDYAANIIWKERQTLPHHLCLELVDKYISLSISKDLNTPLARDKIISQLLRFCTISKDIEVINRLIDSVTLTRASNSFTVQNYAQISVLFFHISAQETLKLQFQIFDCDMDGKISKMDRKKCLMYACKPKLREILVKFDEYNLDPTLEKFKLACYKANLRFIPKFATSVLLHTGFGKDTNTVTDNPIEENFASGMAALSEAFVHYNENNPVNNNNSNSVVGRVIIDDEYDTFVGSVPIAILAHQEIDDENVPAAESLSEQEMLSEWGRVRFLSANDKTT